MVAGEFGARTDGRDTSAPDCDGAVFDRAQGIVHVTTVAPVMRTSVGLAALMAVAPIGYRWT